MERIVRSNYWWHLILRKGSFVMAPTSLLQAHSTLLWHILAGSRCQCSIGKAGKAMAILCRKQSCQEVEQVHFGEKQHKSNYFTKQQGGISSAIRKDARGILSAQHS